MASLKHQTQGAEDVRRPRRPRLLLAPVVALLAISTLALTATPAAAAVTRPTGGSGSYTFSVSPARVPVSIWVTKDAGGPQSLSGWVRFLDTPSGYSTPWTKLGECLSNNPYGVDGSTCKWAGTMSAPYAGWYRVQVAYGWFRTGWDYGYETSAWFYMR